LKFGCTGWVVTSIILITNLTIFLDIPLLRQISGFLFLIILPGLLILHILKPNKIGLTEKFVLLVGLSIAFLMFSGLLLNNVLLSVGCETPLSTFSLLIFFDVIFIILLIMVCKNGGDSIFPISDLNLSASERIFLAIPAFFPVLSIFGAYIMNMTDNNIFLMFVLLAIPTYVIFICHFNQVFPKRFYPVVIYLVSISLLLMFMLRFTHIWGYDVHTEYYVFQMTLDNLHWGIIEHTPLDACLSISLLPAIFQSIMGASAQEYIFKWVYVSICSFCPLAIYVTSKKYVDEMYAFIASFFFISQPTFLSASGSARTNVAIFFVALAVMVLFDSRIDPVKQKILFIIFVLSMVVSHYSTTYIFFFVILFSWIATEILSMRYAFERKISLRTVLFLFVVIFIWYAQVTDTAFNAGVMFIRDTVMNLNNFFIEESRTEMFNQLFGRNLAYSLLSKVNLLITWGTFILIGIGVLTMIKNFQEMIDMPDTTLKKLYFLKTKFEMEYLTMVLVCSGLLVAIIVLPYLSIGYDIYRLYSLVLILLSICFVMGGRVLSKYFRLKPYLIILVILIPYFMFVTGVLYQMFGAPVSIILNSKGGDYNREYVHDSESCAAKWLMMNSGKNSRISVSDTFGKHRLISQGKIPPNRIDDHSFPRHEELQGYIYLYYNNVVKGKLVVNSTSCNMSDYSDMLIGKSKIYGDDNSEVYKT